MLHMVTLHVASPDEQLAEFPWSALSIPTPVKTAATAVNAWVPMSFLSLFIN